MWRMVWRRVTSEFVSPYARFWVNAGREEPEDPVLIDDEALPAMPVPPDEVLPPEGSVLKVDTGEMTWVPPGGVAMTTKS